MKLKTQFVLSIILFGVTVFLIGVAVVYANLESGRLNRQREVAGRIERGMSELSYLSNDYLLYEEEQQRTRWEAKWLSVSKDLSAIEAETPELLTITQHLKEDLQHLKSVFADVSARISGRSAGQDAQLGQDSIRLSWSRLTVQNQNMAFDALRLSRTLGDQQSDLRQRNILLVFILLAAFFAFFISNYLFVSRRTLREISKLQAGMEVIGSGNLDYELDAKRNDEIGDLARAFNAMTANLKNVTSTKAELEKEISERKKAQVALRESEESYRRIVETATEGIWIAEPDGKTAFVNERMAEMLGYRRDELIGRIGVEFLDKDQKDAVPETRAKLAKGQRVYKEIKFKRKDGSALWTQVSVAPLTDNKGLHIGNLSMHTDITERKRSEIELRSLSEMLEVRVAQRTEELKDSESRLRRLSRQLLTTQEVERQRIGRDLHDGVGQLLAGVKYRIEGSLLKMKEQEVDISYLEAVVPILQECIREVRRVQSDLHPTTLETMGIIPTLKVLCRDFADTYPKVSVRHRLSLDENTLSADQKTAIFRVAQEAMNNVAKHSDADTVNMALTQVKDVVRLTVKDNGRGFDPAVVTGANSSAGLGLSSMRERVEPDGGSLSITSSPGIGTIIRATWPLRA